MSVVIREQFPSPFSEKVIQYYNVNLEMLIFFSFIIFILLKLYYFAVDNMDRITIEMGMLDITSVTCVKFVPRTHQADFVEIQPKFG